MNAPAGKSVWDISSEPTWYRKLLKGKVGLGTLWPDENVKSVRVTGKYQGRQRTFDLTKPEEVFPYRDVTDSLEFGSDGHPTFKSLDEASDGIVDEILSSLGENDEAVSGQ